MIKMMDSIAISSVSMISCELRYRVEALYRLSAHPGSMWRGGFGAALKRVCCRHFPRCAKACVETSLCAYGAVFETPQTDVNSRLGDVNQAPRPFAIYPATRGPSLVEAGSRLIVQFTAWGVSIGLFPYLLLAWRELAEQGLLPGSVGAVLEEVHQIPAGTLLYNSSKPALQAPQPQLLSLMGETRTESIRIESLTPVRLQSGNRLFGKGIQAPQPFPVRIFFVTLLRRIETAFPESASYIHYFYERLTEVETAYAKGEATWREIGRWSSRQQTKLLMGGLEGFAEWKSLPGDWAALLRIGEQIQVGKGTTMGLGKFRVISTESI